LFAFWFIFGEASMHPTLNFALIIALVVALVLVMSYLLRIVGELKTPSLNPTLQNIPKNFRFQRPIISESVRQRFLGNFVAFI
jgi:O-antigen/teichoic acid export membrane protein